MNRSPTVLIHEGCADVRIFYLHADTGEYKPSKKGVTLKPHLLPKLQTGINRLIDALHDEISEAEKESDRVE